MGGFGDNNSPTGPALSAPVLLAYCLATLAQPAVHALRRALARTHRKDDGGRAGDDVAAREDAGTLVAPSSSVTR